MGYVVHLINLILVYSILGISMNLLLGYTGLISMTHAGFFAIGAYASALMTMHLGVNFLVGMIAGVAIVSIVGILIAIPALRVRDEYLMLFTLAVQMVIFSTLTTNVEDLGGTTGIIGIPAAAIFGLRFSGPVSYLPLIFVFFGLCLAAMWRLTSSPFGRVLKAIRDDETAVRSLGKNILRFKVSVFVVAGAVAAVAGSVFGHYSISICPSTFSIHESIFIIAIVVIGGLANIWGSVVAAFLLVVVPEALTFLPGGSAEIGAIRMAVYGLLLIVFMRFRSQGILPEKVAFGRRGNMHMSLSSEEKNEILKSLGTSLHSRGSGSNTPPLEVCGVSKNFEGIIAADNISLTLPEGKITALIGPNGAGKTTLFNLITGFEKVDGGRVLLRGREITKFPPHVVSKLGIGRSFQEVRVFPGMSVLDNILVSFANQRGERLFPLFFQPWRVFGQEERNCRRAMAYLDFVGLAEKSQEAAGDLSFAEQKLLVFACLLATEADVLLIDEVVSGVDPKAIGGILDLIGQLSASGKTILIIEHNLDVVKGIADWTYFLAQGHVVATGTPSELMSDAKLAEIYFGA